MISIKQLNECTLSEVVEAVNQGYSDYFMPIRTTPDRIINMMSTKKLSPEYSFVSFYHGKPCGIVLNGIRAMNGKRFAWNGTTAVAPPYRCLGIGSKLMQTTMQLYEKEKVDVATLECFRLNHKAIRLFTEFGYECKEELIFLHYKQYLKPWNHDHLFDFKLKQSTLQEVGKLPFYDHDAPWKSHWDHIKNGQALIVYDKDSRPVAYTLFESIFDDQGRLQTVMLHQCVCIVEQEESIVKMMLNKAFAPWDIAFERLTFNMAIGNDTIVGILKQAGFQTAQTENKISFVQDHMQKVM